MTLKVSKFLLILHTKPLNMAIGWVEFSCPVPLVQLWLIHAITWTCFTAYLYSFHLRTVGN